MESMNDKGTAASMPETVYRPNIRYEIGFFRTIALMAANVVHARHFVWQMFKRNFLASYKKSLLGLAWLIFAPLVGVASWLFLKWAGVLKPGAIEGEMPYAVYVLLGSSMWGLFMGFYNASAETLQAGREFIMQVNYPRETVMFAQTAQHVANFIVAFALNLILLAVFGIAPSWKIVLLPLVVLPMLLFGSGIGLVISMFSVVSNDFKRMADILLALAMWLVPIVYSSTIDVPWLRTVNDWNPLTHLVCSARDIVLYGRLYDPAGFAWASALAIVVYLFAGRLFFLAEDKIVERNI